MLWIFPRFYAARRRGTAIMTVIILLVAVTRFVNSYTQFYVFWSWFSIKISKSCIWKLNTNLSIITGSYSLQFSGLTESPICTMCPASFDTKSSDTGLLLPRSEISTPKQVEDARNFAMRICTALFYAISSLLITVVNKSVLTGYQFPSFQFLAFSQMLTTIVVLYAVKQLGYIKFPDFHFGIFYQLFPLPFLYVGNTVFGLGSTQNLSLPMFTMLRRVSIFMTMVGEYWIFRIKPSLSVQVAIFMMMFGSAVAALQDLAFSVYGYSCVLINDLLTTSNNLVMKLKLDSRKEIGRYGLLYYCSLFMSPISLLLLWQTGDLEKILLYPNWSSSTFLLQYGLSCLMGFILMYSVMVCVHYNSALTTTIIGCLKNILITYLGMYIGGDYVYSLENFIGINISVAGSLLYTWVTFKPQKQTAATSARQVTNTVWI